MIALHLNKMLLSAVVLSCAGCARHSNVDAAAEPAHTAAQATPEPRLLSACEMVTAAEMTKLLGGAVSARPGPSNGQTACIYTAVTGISPYAELKIEWGSGEAGMMGANIANAHEPGLADPLDGLGDQAMNLGPAVMIRRGEDLVTITLSGVDEVLPHVKVIYSLIDKRM